MKKLCFLLLITSTTLLTAQHRELKWVTNFDTAKKLSKRTHKPILMYFTGSDWCAPCKMLKEDFFHSPEFKKTAKDFVLLEVDYPRREDIITEEQRQLNSQLIKKYNKEKTFPKIIVFNSREKIIGTISAYSQLRDPSGYFSFIHDMLKK
ncbi:thioredoxin family protein [Aquimarina sp. TRL1]|uniref:thioredoxin family protein n=1 Tax=Aquimarina sp. (strain TRL1) TaxID=2736252 RepID=UPI0015892B8E|nr:thioredoxin family protein [Aquimarina sp. TRL1]QKX07156.1 thioredoxin family protein [Aquimarina sp. TRL1]